MGDRVFDPVPAAGSGGATPQPRLTGANKDPVLTSIYTSVEAKQMRQTVRVSNLKNHRLGKDGVRFYEVEWEGFPDKTEWTWESRDNLMRSSARVLVLDYDRTHPSAPNTPARSKPSSSNNSPVPGHAHPSPADLLQVKRTSQGGAPASGTQPRGKVFEAARAPVPSPPTATTSAAATPKSARKLDEEAIAKVAADVPRKATRVSPPSASDAVHEAAASANVTVRKPGRAGRSASAIAPSPVPFPDMAAATSTADEIMPDAPPVELTPLAATRRSRSRAGAETPTGSMVQGSGVTATGSVVKASAVGSVVKGGKGGKGVKRQREEDETGFASETPLKKRPPPHAKLSEFDPRDTPVSVPDGVQVNDDDDCASSCATLIAFCMRSGFFPTERMVSRLLNFIRKGSSYPQALACANVLEVTLGRAEMMNLEFPFVMPHEGGDAGFNTLHGILTAVCKGVGSSASSPTGGPTNDTRFYHNLLALRFLVRIFTQDIARWLKVAGGEADLHNSLLFRLVEPSTKSRRHELLALITAGLARANNDEMTMCLQLLLAQILRIYAPGGSDYADALRMVRVGIDKSEYQARQAFLETFQGTPQQKLDLVWMFIFAKDSKQSRLDLQALCTHLSTWKANEGNGPAGVEVILLYVMHLLMASHTADILSPAEASKLSAETKRFQERLKGAITPRAQGTLVAISMLVEAQ